jgi:hypothetical protein
MRLFTPDCELFALAFGIAWPAKEAGVENLNRCKRRSRVKVPQC